MVKSRTSRIAGKALVYVDDSLPGITRRRAGKGWSYRDAEGERITDRDEIDRLNAIAMPPAYTDCWFCPAANGHILATGMDARGRKQYRYNPDFRALRESEKFGGIADFGRMLPLLRKRVKADIASPKLSHDRAIASVLRLLDTGRIRIGNEQYFRANGSFGASTLRKRHAQISGSALKLQFKAKSGKMRQMRVTDRSLSCFVRRVQDLPGQHLFQYVDDDGNSGPISSSDVNQYIRESMGGDFTAKHFRTWHASVIAFRELAECKEDLAIGQLMDVVGEHLGNTPAIARKSYVHPAVTALVEGQDEWRNGLKLPRKTQWLSRYERALIVHLDDQPSHDIEAAA